MYQHMYVTLYHIYTCTRKIFFHPLLCSECLWHEDGYRDGSHNTQQHVQQTRKTEGELGQEFSNCIIWRERVTRNIRRVGTYMYMYIYTRVITHNLTQHVVLWTCGIDMSSYIHV